MWTTISNSHLTYDPLEAYSTSLIHLNKHKVYSTSSLDNLHMNYIYLPITCIQFHLLLSFRHFIKHLVCVLLPKHDVQVFHVFLPSYHFHSSIQVNIIQLYTILNLYACTHHILHIFTINFIPFHELDINPLS